MTLSLKCLVSTLKRTPISYCPMKNYLKKALIVLHRILTDRLSQSVPQEPDEALVNEDLPGNQVTAMRVLGRRNTKTMKKKIPLLSNGVCIPYSLLKFELVISFPRFPVL